MANYRTPRQVVLVVIFVVVVVVVSCGCFCVVVVVLMFLRGWKNTEFPVKLLLLLSLLMLLLSCFVLLFCCFFRGWQFTLLEFELLTTFSC